MTFEPMDDATRMARLWDELGEGAEVTAPIEADWLAEIRWLESLAHTPAPKPGLAEETWEQIAGSPLSLATFVPVSAPNANGRYAEPIAVARPASAPSSRNWLLAEIYRFLAVAAMAGFAGGFVSGLWARIAMRISGIFTVDRHRGLLTDNDAVVGNMTVDGTLSIAMFGAVIGILVGLLYMAIRRWIPGRGWQRPLIYGGLLLAVFGFVIMDESNPDYQLFGPAWMNVGSFSLAYIVMGFTVGMLADYLDKRLAAAGAPVGSRRGSAVMQMLMMLFAFFGGVGVIFTVVTTSGIGALCVLLIGCPWLLIARPNLRLRLPAFLQQPAKLAYVTLAIPSLFGLTLTLRAIAAIVSG